MKKFTKGMLIAAGIFGAVGIGLTAAGGVMGASMSELTGVKSLKRVLLVADGDYDYDDSDDYDDDDDDDYEDVKPRASKSKPSFSKPAARSASKYEAATQQASTTHRSTAGSSSSGKLVDFKDSQKSYSRSSDFRNRSEVFVIKPQETDEAQSVIDFLRANKTIVINIEGLDVAVAQRIIDYVGGACYAMGGSLNVVSSNIFIATPQDIEVSGDLREELVGQDALTPYVQY